MTVSIAVARDAFTILESVVMSRLALITPSILVGGANWRINPLDQARKLPWAIAQPQSAGNRQPFIGRMGWRGPLVVRVVGATQVSADSAASACCDALIGTWSYGTPAAYSVTIAFDQLLLLDVPTGISSRQAGHQYIVEIHQS
jgi:hypothetical protein